MGFRRVFVGRRQESLFAESNIPPNTLGFISPGAEKNKKFPKILFDRKFWKWFCNIFKFVFYVFLNGIYKLCL